MRSRFKQRGVVAGLLGLGLLWGPEAGAEVLRCAGGFIREGDIAPQVLRVCGQPWRSERIAASELAALVGSARQAKGGAQMWTYNFGPSKFMRHLYFVDGRLRLIKTGPRGTRSASPG